MKSSRKGLTKDIAVPESYDAFFSFPVKKTGYSGVATYSRIVPSKAEEGLTGLLDLKPPLEASERVSSSYPSIPDLDLRNLDSEGRVVILDYDAFVLINVYAPNDGTEAEDRIQFKIDFQRLLEERVRHLIDVDHRQVIVVGDLNACAALIDHCEGPLMAKKLGFDIGSSEAENSFWQEKQCRAWLRNWLVEHGGPMIDVVRRQWPERKGMFTCWNTKISARDSNYGTRIDYILVTAGLLPFVKDADILPDIKGSDHCPVYLDLDDSVFDQEPKISVAPRLAARYWDEFSGKQKQLGDFFSKKGASPRESSQPSSSSSSQSKIRPSSSSQPASAKRKRIERVPSSSKKAKPAPGQGKISSFFGTSSKADVVVDEDDDEDYRLALTLSQQPSSPSASTSKSKDHWTTLMAPVPTPRCIVHDEPAKELTTKQGVNKGKMFWICSR